MGRPCTGLARGTTGGGLGTRAITGLISLFPASTLAGSEVRGGTMGSLACFQSRNTGPPELSTTDVRLDTGAELRFAVTSSTATFPSDLRTRTMSAASEPRCGLGGGTGSGVGDAVVTGAGTAMVRCGVVKREWQRGNVNGSYAQILEVVDGLGRGQLVNGAQLEIEPVDRRLR